MAILDYCDQKSDKTTYYTYYTYSEYAFRILYGVSPLGLYDFTVTG